MSESVCAIPVERPRGAGFVACAALPLPYSRETRDMQARFGGERFLIRLARRTAPFALLSWRFAALDACFKRSRRRGFSFRRRHDRAKPINVTLPAVLAAPEVEVVAAVTL